MIVANFSDAIYFFPLLMVVLSVIVGLLVIGCNETKVVEPNIAASIDNGNSVIEKARTDRSAGLFQAAVEIDWVTSILETVKLEDRVLQDLASNYV